MTRRSVAAAGSTLLLLSGAWAAGPGADFNGADPTDTAYPVVITPTRLHQSLGDVPAAVTVITAETIRRYSIASIPEALRLVPGMQLLQATGNDWRINYHGGYAFTPRRLNVLVDGVSVYRPGLARVEWAQLPVALEDVERIEVIRGPDSAAYGPNSMTAVVNILTRHPKDVERALASVTAGSHGTAETTLRMATSIGPTSLRATLSTHRDSGYDQLPSEASGHDSTRVHRFNLRAISELADGSSLDLQAAYAGGRLEATVTDPLRTTDNPDQRRAEMTLSGRWTKPLSATHELQLTAFASHASSRQTWRTCWPRLSFVPQLGTLYASNPGYVARLLAGGIPSGGTLQDDLLLAQLVGEVVRLGGFAAAAAPVCGWANQDGVESRRQLELQDTLVLSDSLRAVAGGGIRYQRIDSQTYIGGEVGNTVRWAFGHAEYRPLHWLTANLGGYYESNSLSGSSFSPRAALNLHLTPTQALRIVVSKGTRSPDIYEERGVWTYTLSGLTPSIDGRTTAPIQLGGRVGGGLGSERIFSRELGWVLSLPNLGLTLDTRIFDDRLSRLTPSLPLNGLSNRGHVRLSGTELQSTWELARGWSAMLGYAYLINRDTPDLAEKMQYSRHSGHVGLSRALPDNWRASLACYAASGDGYGESRYLRTDLTLAHGFRIGPLAASAGLVLSYLDEPSATTVESSFPAGQRLVRAGYDDGLGARASLRVSF